MSRDNKAKQIKILDLLAGYPSLVGANLSNLTSAMATAVDDFDLEAVALACKRFATGQVPGYNRAFPPTAAELSEQARIHHDIANPKVVSLYNGLIEMDWGHGKVDMRGLTVAEQDEIIKNHGMIDKKNAAMMSLDEKRSALKRIAAPANTRRIETKVQKF